MPHFFFQVLAHDHTHRNNFITLALGERWRGMDVNVLLLLLSSPPCCHYPWRDAWEGFSMARPPSQQMLLLEGILLRVEPWG